MQLTNQITAFCLTKINTHGGFAIALLPLTTRLSTELFEAVFVPRQLRICAILELRNANMEFQVWRANLGLISANVSRFGPTYDTILQQQDKI